jgi:UDP-N-acetylglucosamine transferase subunit ALG13
VNDAAVSRPLVFVTVGTDHHPFDRLLAWIDEWLVRGDGDARVLVQSGTSRGGVRGEVRPYLDIEEMERAVAEATVVVCHGGPGTIMLARRFGKKPVVVPRLRALGEHVDDHQVRFAERLAAAGHIATASDAAALHHVLDAALRDPSLLRIDPRSQEVTDAVAAFARRVGRLFGAGVHAEEPMAPSAAAGAGR